MPKPRKEGNKFTTIAISWIDKDILRTLAMPVKQTKNGTVYESDAAVLNRIFKKMGDFCMLNPSPTYPSKALRDVSPQD